MWLKVLFVLCFQLMVVRPLVTASTLGLSTVPTMTNGTFLYFAYGSNLLNKRIHIQNPSAVRRGVARLKDHRLDFSQWAKRWNGPPLTIVPDEGRVVWGALWEIGNEHLASLDTQEGVHERQYRPIEVTVETPTGEEKTGRVYVLFDNPGPLKAGQEFTNLPSETYIQVVISGAIESGLPEEYIEWLKTVKNNGQKAVPELLESLKGELEKVRDILKNESIAA